VKLSLVIPTYNEVKNLEELVTRLHDSLTDYDHEFIVMDDNSPDGTAGLAEILSDIYPLKVIVRKDKRGLASAILDGFEAATGEVLGVIDADLQHPPEVIRDLAANIGDNDIVIASRYVPNGGIENWPAFRRVVSQWATLLARPLTSVKDPMAGCFMLKAGVIKGISFNPAGYKILLELLVKGQYKKVIEVPYIFKVRLHGESKLGIDEYLKYLKLLLDLYQYKYLGRGK